MPAVRLVITFTCESKEQADARAETMIERCKAAQQEPGCLQFDVVRNLLHPEQYVLLEHWESEEALETHRLASLPGPAALPSGIRRLRETYFYHEGETPAGV
jgi:quinol monooxygenase YgiN